MGDPAELASRYNREGADELVFLDISASREGRATFLETIRRVAEQLNIPLTAGGGIRKMEDGRGGYARRRGQSHGEHRCRRAARIDFGTRAAIRSQAVVLSMDVKRVGCRWEAFSRGGRDATGIDAENGSQEACRAGREKFCSPPSTAMARAADLTAI